MTDTYCIYISSQSKLTAPPAATVAARGPAAAAAALRALHASPRPLLDRGAGPALLAGLQVRVGRDAGSAAGGYVTWAYIYQEAPPGAARMVWVFDRLCNRN